MALPDAATRGAAATRGPAAADDSACARSGAADPTAGQYAPTTRAGEVGGGGGPGDDVHDWVAAGTAALGSLLGDRLGGLPTGSEALLGTILDALPDGVKLVDREMRVVHENRAMRERFAPALAGSTYVLGDARTDAGLECPAASALLDGLPHEAVREVTLADGERAYFDIRSTPLFDREGRLVGALMLVRDETLRVLLDRDRARDGAEVQAAPRRTGSWMLFELERTRYTARLQQQVEARTAELARAKETLHSILDGIPDPIALVDASDCRLLFTNAAAKALPDDLTQTLKQCLCRMTLEAGRTVTRQIEHVDSEGRRRVFESFVYPAPSIKAGRTLAIYFARDITERLALQQQVIRAERLAVVGELAAGLAHEIRTPLTSISNSVRLLQGTLPGAGGEDARLLLGIIAKEAKRLSALLTDFLKFARPRPPRPAPTDLNGLVREVVRLARDGRVHAEAVSVELALADDLPEAPVDRDQLQQALLNLVVNGLEACLSVRREPGAQPPRLTVRTAGPGQGRAGWEITISDTGPGIAPEDRARLFEPFFSKKPDGTGLGLAITKRILDAHGGRIEVSSAPGAGATFTLVLPATGALQGA